MFAVSMPNFFTSAALVETATKCLATDRSSPPRPATDQARAVRAFVIVSSVVKVLDDTMKRVSDGFREVGAVDVGDEPERHGALAVVAERLVGHDRPQIRAADADVDDVADALSGVALPGAALYALGEVGHLVEHGVDPRHDVL